jgi:hypothetical protein
MSPPDAPPEAGALPDAELHFFSGSSDTVARRLFALPRDTVERGLWALLLQSPDGAHIQVQERAGPGAATARVRAWAGKDLGSLPARLTGHLATGSYQELRTALSGHGDYTDLGEVPCPPTPRGAFGHPLKLHTALSGLRVWILVL